MRARITFINIERKENKDVSILFCDILDLRNNVKNNKIPNKFAGMSIQL